MSIGPKQLLSVAAGVMAVCLVFSHVAQARTPAEGGITPPAATPSPSAVRASGTILASDNFSNASTGILPQSADDSPFPTRILRGYVNGEYQLATTDPACYCAAFALVPGTFTDVQIDVDVRLVNPNPSVPSQGVFVQCRTPATGAAPGWYELQLEPVSQTYSLLRADVTNVITNSPPILSYATLKTDTNVAAINPGAASNHVTFTCAGNTIAASINGTQVASVQDSAYTSGSVELGAAILAQVSPVQSATVDARLSNLVITQP